MENLPQASLPARGDGFIAPLLPPVPSSSRGLLCVCLHPKLPLRIRTSVIRFRARANSVCLHLTLQITSAKIPFLNKVTFIGSRGTLLTQ